MKADGAVGRGCWCLAVAVGLAIASTACQGDGIGLTPSGDPFAVGYAAEIQPIFDRRCVRCHAPGLSGFTATGGAQGGLDLTSRGSYQSLVEQPTFQAPSTPPLFRVRPGRVAESYLVEKIVSDSPKSGERMPLSGPPFLSQAEVLLIEEWIRRGARND